MKSEVMSPKFFERKSFCSQHGPYLERGVYMSKDQGPLWFGCPLCDKEARERDEQYWKNREANRRLDLISAVLDRSSAIPLRFKGRGFDEYQTDNQGQKNAVEGCRFFVEHFEEFRKRGKGLSFFGKNGTGKTHLSLAILQALYPDVIGAYVTMPALLDLLRSSTVDRDALRRILTRNPLLVMDEFYKPRWDSELKEIFTVLDYRYQMRIPTVLVTNLTPTELQKTDKSIYSRLYESSVFFEFGWCDYRLKKSK